MRYLKIIALGVVGAFVVVALGAFFHFELGPLFSPPEAATPASQPHQRPLEPLPDVDALALRLPYNQSVYTQLRDEALADYSRLHPQPGPTSAEAQGTLKLLAYLCVWDDFYGEGLWTAAVAHARHLEETTPDNQIWRSLDDISYYADRYSTKDDDASQLTSCSDRLIHETWPAAFRLRACEVAMRNMANAKNDATIQPPLTTSLAALAPMADNAVACFREIIRAHPTHAYLFAAGDKLLEDASTDEPTLIQVSKGLDAAFAAEDGQNPEAVILDGDFYLKDAWNARGSDYANSVTPEGWRLFAQRLQRAQAILEGVYAHTPQEPGIARCMMTAVLGEQLPREQMEMWFQRGQDVEGNLFSLYTSKRWYLLPRWYGSDQDVWEFGLECAKSPNWPAKIPIMLAECISDRAENDPGVFAQPEIWQPLEQVYRGYLSRYPQSSHYRSLFALNAAQGGHWDVAKEQFKILGDDWDPDVFPDNLYAETMQKVNAN